jgi:hypothetical protein
MINQLEKNNQGLYGSWIYNAFFLSVLITTKVMSLNPAQASCTINNI